jgi:hypothetical protein
MIWQYPGVELFKWSPTYFVSNLFILV